MIQATSGSAAVARAHPLGLYPADIVPFGDFGRVALLFNERAHRNRHSANRTVSSRVWLAAPDSKAELDHTLASFAQEKIGTIIIDGGDGTVRDVISRARRHFPDGLPRLAIVPSGKTNALAADLGISGIWTVDDVLSLLPRYRTVRRTPLEIRYGNESEPRLRGFVFGTGAFVRATSLAQSVHRAGAFDGLAVGLSLIGAVARTLFGSKTSEWRRGDAVTFELDGRAIHREFYLLLGSTLERMPLGLRPFGQVRSGLKLLGIDAPPRKALLAAAAVAAGSERKWLSEHGYERVDADSFRLVIDSDFMLDGESFPGGDLIISKGAPIDFLVPA